MAVIVGMFYCKSVQRMEDEASLLLDTRSLPERHCPAADGQGLLL